MTWEEAKDQIARTQGYTQWDMIIVEGVNVFGGLSQIEMLEEAAKLYARSKWDEACKEQRKLCHENRRVISGVASAPQPEFKP